MRILLTGHKGYIGSRLYKQLLSLGHDVVGIDLQEGKNVITSHLPDVDVVYHLAAQAGAVSSVEDPLWDAETNILGTIRIAKHYGNSETKIVYTTSGGAKDPKSPYGLSKKCGEGYLRLLAASNTVTCRLSSIYGEKPRGVVDTFIKDKELTIFGDGSAIRDFVHVDDIVVGLVLAMNWEPMEYEMGTGAGITVQEIAAATGKKCKYYPEREGELYCAVLQNTTPDWVPGVNVIDYVRSKC